MWQPNVLLWYALSKDLLVLLQSLNLTLFLVHKLYIVLTAIRHFDFAMIQAHVLKEA